MAISFEESLKRATATIAPTMETIKATKATAVVEAEMVAEVAPIKSSVAPLSVADVADYGIATLDMSEENMIAAYSGDNETWHLSEKYQYYPEYNDDSVSTVDKLKKITLAQDQINLTQETNSQFIPFELPRYYDGFDLYTTNLMVHFVNAGDYEDFSTPINVYYNAEKIKFGWLVDKRVTAVEGKVQFEIQARGWNSKGDEYIWKTQPCGGLNILESLSGNGVIEPDSTWITGFLTQVTEKVAEAQAAADEAASYVATVEGYAAEAQAAAQEANRVVDDAKAELKADVDASVDRAIVAALVDYPTEDEVTAEINTKISDALLNYYTKPEVDEIVANIDISDQLEEIKTQINNLDGLAKFDVTYDGTTMTFWNGDEKMKEIAINSDPSVEWTSAYTKTVEDKIAAAKSENSQELNDYKEIVDADLQSIHDSIDGLPETLQQDYYNKISTDEKFATKTDLNATGLRIDAVESTANANKSDVSTLSGKVVELQEEVSSIDKSPRLTYEATYDEEQIYTLWEIEGEGDGEVRTPKGQFKIVGGGGSATSSVLKIEYVTKTPYVATKDATVELSYIFSGTDSGGDVVQEGTATWKVAGNTVATEIVPAGENKFDVTKYLNIGTQKVMLSITDDAGSLVTKSWTVQVVDVRLTSTFDDKLTYSPGNVAFGYTPYGAIEKTVHFEIDGEEVGTFVTSASGIPMDYTIPGLTHGSHLLRVYMTAQISSNNITSNEILKDVLILDENETTPVIGCTLQEFTTKQYDTTNIQYTVYDPKTESPTVTLAVDGVVVKESKLTAATDTWAFKSSELGEHTLTITCGETIKTLKATVVELGIDISPVTAGLAFDFNPVGYSNTDTDRLWSNGDVSMTVSDNFDWINGGYQLDENGDQYFCVKAGTSATIDYALFADDAKKNGKEFKLVFKTTNVARPDATFLSCMDNTTETDHIGIQMNVHEAIIYGQAGSLELSYSEEDIIEFEFNISKNTEAVPMVMGYEDGVSTRPMVYDDSYNFTQNAPKHISIGSEDCDLHIYRMKVYNTSMTDRGILNNFIADARNAEAMISRYNRNQIYDENQMLDPDVLAQKCPWLRVYKLSAPYFTNNKSDKVPGTTIQQIYKDGDPTLDNWTCYDCQHSGQGTSSNNYGAAGRNLDFIMNKSGVDGVKPYFIMGDGSRAEKITMTRKSVPVAYLNAKVNIASSNNMTNAMLANRYNEFNPYKRPFVRDEGVDTSFIKDTMQFANCVIFIKETNEDLSTHREFADTSWHKTA